MTIKEFLEAYNYAPYGLEEIAGLVVEIIDGTDLVDAAKAFLEAKEKLEMMLADIGFEFG